LKSESWLSFPRALALNLEEGGEMLQPMAAGAIGGLGLGLLVALFLMPCLYVVFSGKGHGQDNFPPVSGKINLEPKD
jgi:hypothetical protein